MSHPRLIIASLHGINDLLGMLIGAIISLLLLAWVNHQPGTLIELPPIFAPYFNA